MPRPRHTTPRPRGRYWGHTTLDQWATDVRARREAYPTRQEIQAAITALLTTGLEVQEVAERLGMSRQMVHRYDTSAGPKAQTWRNRPEPDTEARP